MKPKASYITYGLPIVVLDKFGQEMTSYDKNWQVFDKKWQDLTRILTSYVDFRKHKDKSTNFYYLLTIPWF